jgi:hypothetical protein
VEVTPISLPTTLLPFKKIYKQLTLAVHRLNPLAIIPNLYLVPAY